MVKIFVGNLPQEATEDEIKALFAEYGRITECAIVKNFAFVHMDDRKDAVKAIKNLHLHNLHGSAINVEASHKKNYGAVKLHVSNVERGEDDDLRALFEEYGIVTECAVIKNFAFVHMANSDEAMDAIQGIDNTEFHGRRIHVQISKSRPRGEEQEDYPPPPEGGGFWPPPHYPVDRPEPPPPGYMRGRPHMAPGYPAPPLPPPPPRRPAYPERPYEGERGDYGVVDYYEKYRARPYGYEAQRPGGPLPPPPPPPPSVARDRLMNPPLDPYERRPPPPPPPPPPSAYYARDRSPHRRPSNGAIPPAGNGYSYERSHVPPVSRVPPYGVPRPRDHYAERLPPPPPPPPARYY